MGNKGLTNIEVKKVNRNQVFRLINQMKRISKPEIAKNLNLSMPTVMTITNELIQEGFIKTSGSFKSSGGRRAEAVSPIQDQHLAIGLDITKHHVGLVLTDLSGEVLQHERFDDPFTNTKVYYEGLAKTVHQFIDNHTHLDQSVLGIGISVPGIVNTATQQIIYSHALGIPSLDFRLFTDAFHLPCIITNDANAACFAEIYHKPDLHHMVYLSLSNTVGGAIVEQKLPFQTNSRMDDLIYMGHHYRSAEFGHMTLIQDGLTCYCGQAGCVDAYCSAKVLSKYHDDHLEDFFDGLASGDGHHEAVFETYLTHLANGIHNVHMFYDSPIIIGGYVGSFIAPYLPRLKEKLRAKNPFKSDGDYIMPCHYQVEASALGAALAIVEERISRI